LAVDDIMCEVSKQMSKVQYAVCKVICVNTRFHAHFCLFWRLRCEFVIKQSLGSVCRLGSEHAA
jgi:hypothetical protein